MLTSPIPWWVPGPFLARLTSKWILFVDLSGRRASTVDALHRKYGPVVCLSPNELSFASIDAIKPIYGAGTTCVKSSAYNNFGRLGMFQMQDPEAHRQRQRRVAHIFAASSLQQMEPLIQSVIDRVMDAISKRARAPVDALHWCRMTALDVSGEVLMGKPFGAFDGEEEAPVYIHHLDNAYLVWLLNGLAPFLFQLLTRLPIKGLQHFLAAKDYVYQYGDDALREYLKLHGRNSSRRTLLTKLLAGDPVTGAEPLSDAEISVEVSNLVFAATDTTGNTMAYALYRLSCHPEWQSKLRDEIRASGARDNGFAFQTLQSLPILNGIVMETLRLHPAAPSALPRVTTAENTNICGLRLPPKVNCRLTQSPKPTEASTGRMLTISQTVVSMQAYTTQRDPTYFPDPEKFDPSRWLTTTAVKNGASSSPTITINPGTPEVREMMLVWGRGTRVCLGQHMATMELKILLARLMDRFEVTLQSAATHDEMVMTDHFTLIPEGKRCGLVFTEV